MSDEYCAHLMDYLRQLKTCEWCKHPHEPIMPRVRLCSHCNRLRLKHKKLLEYCQQYAQTHGGITYSMDFNLRVTAAMIENAKLEGRKYGHFFDEDFSGTKLEYEWRSISEKATGKDLFYGITSRLNYSFTINQRRYIFYLLSLMSRTSMRKNRYGAGMGRVVQKTIDDPAPARRSVIQADSSGSFEAEAEASDT